MPRDAVSRTANVEHTGRHKWVKPHIVQQLSFQDYVSRLYIFSAETMIKEIKTSKKFLRTAIFCSQVRLYSILMMKQMCRTVDMVFFVVMTTKTLK